MNAVANVLDLVVRYELTRAADGTWGAQAFVPGVTGFPLWDGVRGEKTPEAALRAVQVELRRRALRGLHEVIDRDHPDFNAPFYAALREDCAAHEETRRTRLDGLLVVLMEMREFEAAASLIDVEHPRGWLTAARAAAFRTRIRQGSSAKSFGAAIRPKR